MKWMDLAFQVLHRWIRQLFILSFKRAWVSRCILIVLLVTASMFLPQLKFLVMMSDLLDKDFETYSQFQQLNNDFTEENQVSVLIESSNGQALSFKQHCSVVQWLTKVQLQQNNISRIFSTYGFREFKVDSKGFTSSPILVPNCSAETTDEAELKLQMERVSNSPSGIILTNKIKNDVFASFFLRNQEEDGRFGHFDKYAFESLRKSFVDEVKFKDLEINATWIGIGTYQYYLQVAYEQMSVVNIVTMILVLLSFRIIFGYWKIGAFFLGNYLISLWLIYGFMSIMKFPVDTLSAAIPIMLLISKIEDFIFFLVLQRQTQTFIGAFQKLIIPSFYTSLTTSIGFLTLCLSDLSIIRRFGLICGLGSMIEWAVFFLIFPSLLIWFKKKNNDRVEFVKISPKLLNVLNWFSSMHSPKWLSLATLLPILFVLFNFKGSLKVDDSPEAVFPTSHPVRQATEKLLEGRGWKSEVNLVFSENISSILRQEIIQKILEENSELVGYEGLEETKEFMLKNIDSESLKTLIAGFIANSNISERWVSPQSSVERIILFSNTSDVVKINNLRKNVSLICQDRCYLANILVSYSEFGLKVLSTLTESFISCIIIIGLLLILLCLHLRIKNIFSILISAIWGPVILIFIFIVFDIGIYFATSVVMSVLVGLAGDNALQFIFYAKNGKLQPAMEGLALASVITLILMMTLSFGFLFSDFEGVKKIGLMMMIGFLLGWIGDLVILRGLLSRA